MTREQFHQLQLGERLRGRDGRAWTVHAGPFDQHGVRRIVIRSGALVRLLDERWADDYEMVTDAGE